MITRCDAKEERLEKAWKIIDRMTALCEDIKTKYPDLYAEAIKWLDEYRDVE